MGEKEIVLIVVLIVLAVFLHIFSVCGWYRRGFDEGYEKGLASRKEPVDGPKVTMKVNNIKTIRSYFQHSEGLSKKGRDYVAAELERNIFEQLRPYIRKAEDVRIYGNDKKSDFMAEIKIVDERGEVLER